MAKPKKETDPYVQAIQSHLEEEYLPDHPDAEVEVKRYNSASIRVRIIDPAFAGQNLTARDTEIWKLLEALPDDIRAEINLLLLLTPPETETSLMNREFENPTPTRL
jgi:hypothetical protein